MQINKAPKSAKNKSILLQSVLLIMLLFGISIAVNCYYTYQNFSDLFIKNLKTESNHIKFLVRDIYKQYSSISWLFDYWQENYKALDVARNPFGWQKYYELPPEILANVKNISSEQVESLSPEHQKLFAELCYRKILIDLDMLRHNMQIHNMYIVRHLPDEGSFAFYYSDFTEEEVNVLGDIFIFSMSKHPVIEKLYASNNESTEFERFSIDNYSLTGKKEYFVVDNTLIRDNKGKVLACISITFLETELKQAILHEVFYLVLINILCFISLGLLLLFGINLQILKPLSKIQEYVKKYTSDKDSTLIVSQLQKIKSHNEIGRLADDISSLAVELDHYTNETAKLSAEKAKIASELSLAALIQNDALPKNFPDIKKFKLYALLKPAQDIGGDLYDFFMLDDDHIALVVGDVSGKGISAALFMMKVKTELKASALLDNYSPKEIIANLNEKLCEENDAMMFVTLWFGIMTISTGEIVYVNAGHEYPIIKADNGLFVLNKSRHTPPLAVMPKMKLNEEKLILKPGDTFFIYTDGVPEANNENGEQFGLNNIIGALNENPESDPEELSNSLLHNIENFAGDAPQFDDTTILCLKYFG